MYQQLEEIDCLSGYSETAWYKTSGISGLGDEGMQLREPVIGGLFPWTVSGQLVSTVGVFRLFPSYLLVLLVSRSHC